MAYAAVVSLMQTLEKIRDGHGILHNNSQIESLLEKVIFLHSFLQNSSRKSSTRVTNLETQIRDAAYAAQDVIDSHISDQLLSVCECCLDKSYTVLYQELQKLIRNLDCISSKIVELRDTSFFQNLQPKNFLSPASLRTTSSGKYKMVGFVDALLEIKDRLTGSSSNNLQVVSIVGMGGSGKTTLARSIYGDALIQDHFYVRAWITVSQEYNGREVLLGLVQSITQLTRKICEESTTADLAEYLYKSLKGRRYLIILDDMWDVEVWHDIKRILPDDGNRSRVVLTSRNSDVALYAGAGNAPYHMRFLSNSEGWNLLQEKVFGEECCPVELKRVGMEIAQICGGLPLAILLVGGVLTKVQQSQDEWEHVAENIKEVMATQNDEGLAIISLSYNHLPHHLRVCFLYMGVFPEDYQISVSKLILLWAAEGFLEPDGGESLEDAGLRYLKDLIDRSLVIVGARNLSGKIATCAIHDLVRDLCVREARKEKFLHILKGCDDLLTKGTNAQRCLSIHSKLLSADASYRDDSLVSICALSDGHLKRIYDSMRQTPLIRSVIFTGSRLNFVYLYLGFRLLRVLDAFLVTFHWFPSEVVLLVHLRYLSFSYNGDLPASLSNLRDLKILVVNQVLLGPISYLPSEIWTMPQLRHLKLKESFFPDYPNAHFPVKITSRLENLQTLSGIKDLRVTEDFFRGIPSLKKLGIMYDRDSAIGNWSFYCLNNLVYLHQLETLKCQFQMTKHVPSSRMQNLPDLVYPSNLKKLTLQGWKISGKDMRVVGSLQNLEILKLQSCAFEGNEWQPLEGEFCRLKALLLEKTGLVHWKAETEHFPNLQRLIIDRCKELEEIPSSFGDIPTLQLIILIDCSFSCNSSAKQMQDQLNMGNNDLKILINPNLPNFFCERKWLFSSIGEYRKLRWTSNNFFRPHWPYH